MLTDHDDFPLHQTPEPIAHPATTDRNFYDRYWFNGFDSDGELYFAIGMALYPNRAIQDAALSIVQGGVQHALHASRRAPSERRETCVAPLRLEVVEPMRVLRAVVEPNETGIEADLVFRASTAPIEEGRTIMRGADGRVTLDSTRFDQLGHWEGTLRFEGRRVDVTPERFRATRDRSWGVRPVGEPASGGAPAGLPQVYFFWAPIQFDDVGLLASCWEDAEGHKWHADAQLVPTYASPADLPGVRDPRVERLATFEQRVRYRKGTRWAERTEIDLIGRDGGRRTLELEPVLRFQMLGLGYGHPEWGHGFWKGESALGVETFKLDDLDPLELRHLHVQQVCRARLGERQGMGVLEQIHIGPHRPSGFSDLLDGA